MIGAATISGGKTLLHIAAEVYNYSFCEAAIENGLDVNALTPDGETPLHLVARSECEPREYEDLREVAELLIEKGADINAVDTRNIPVLSAALERLFKNYNHYGYFFGDDEEFVKLFLEHPDIQLDLSEEEHQRCVDFVFGVEVPCRDLIVLVADKLSTIRSKHWCIEAINRAKEKNPNLDEALINCFANRAL